MKKLHILWILLTISNLAVAKEEKKKSPPSFSFEVPTENMIEGKTPPLKEAEEAAKRILTAITNNTPETVQDLFFPEKVFEGLKDIQRPLDYYKKLTKWFVADIKREHERIKSKPNLVFDGFQKGRCKWKAVGSEYNKIAYWSCYRNYFYAKSGEERIKFEMRALINWGMKWHVTHLGAIPKE